MARTKCVRYVIVLDRFDDDDYAKNDSIGHESGHDGSAQAACEQVSAELQEAMNQTGQPAGFFNVIERRVIDYKDSVTDSSTDAQAASLGIERRMESDPAA